MKRRRRRRRILDHRPKGMFCWLRKAQLCPWDPTGIPLRGEIPLDPPQPGWGQGFGKRCGTSKPCPFLQNTHTQLSGHHPPAPTKC